MADKLGARSSREMMLERGVGAHDSVVNGDTEETIGLMLITGFTEDF